MKRKVFICSLGCAKNLADSEDMAGALKASGCEVVFDEREADILLLNTCGFLKSAVCESKKEIKYLLGFGKKLIVAGCLVERTGKSLFAKYPGVHAFVGTNSLENIVKAAQEGGAYLNEPRKGRPVFRSKYRFTASHSAYLKIADGCGNRCSYCAIPFIKGPFRSKPEENVMAEAKALAETGAVEISLLAQDTTNYGLDLRRKPRLTGLLKKLAKIKNLKWIRIMYANPEGVDGNLMDLIKNETKICDYLDMPLQHISDKILKAMNRKADSKTIMKVVEKLKKKIPGIGIRTNFIAGFPGETEKDFNALLKFVREAEFANVGVFAYSREKGTPACGLKGQISEKEKTARINALIDVQSRVLDKVNKKLIGKRLKILMDSGKSGRAYFQAPEIDGKVVLADGFKAEPGRFVKAKIVARQGCGLIAKL